MKSNLKVIAGFFVLAVFIWAIGVAFDYLFPSGVLLVHMLHVLVGVIVAGIFAVVAVRALGRRKQAEEALDLERRQLLSIFDSIDEPVYVSDPDSYEVLYANQALKNSFGNVVGQKCYQAFQDMESPCSFCTNERIFGENAGQPYIWEFQNKINHRWYRCIDKAIRWPDGRMVRYEMAIDITERKQAEERERRLQEELNRASRLASIGELAAGVAHEVNNPLTGILVFSQRLLRKSTDEKVSRDLERIHNEARRAAKVVEHLLTFARRREPKKEYSDINDILQKALELRAYEVKTSNIEVVTDLAPSLPKIMVDFYQIEEVFLNIILNTEQVMVEANRGGKLSIKTEEMKGYIRVSFADDGPGIPAKHLSKVFDPFFTTRGEKGGTGLGLSVCHGIVTEHGGRIYAKSKLGEGATFFVELPLIIERIDKSKVLGEEPARKSK